MTSKNSNEIEITFIENALAKFDSLGAYNPLEGGQYRLDDKCCFIGASIPDDEYAEWMEGDTCVKDVISTFITDPLPCSLLVTLTMHQDIHDSWTEHNFIFSRVFKDFGMHTNDYRTFLELRLKDLQDAQDTQNEPT